eukprot:CAMPEP_0194146948 /NCGR_PEP_ID=MMETSP0152-20130528/22431_1 /TAXON_ID=1049557 /ORGANISM="Thalassiothrix antarctica, Strain L6-D1" /LENGTH=168 /DNA_ID=CAMNT_0038847607 /DNA_START=178 /DNA_END=684 /DNA_ORIENTATION=-
MTITSSSSLKMGNIIDDLKLIFSDEGKKNRAAYEAREREEAEKAQLEVLERRRNPELMEQYNEEKNANRQKLNEDRDVWDFQQKKGGKGYDPLDEWNKLRKEGKIKVGSDLERDEGTRRLGSEGLIDVRIDERMPYIDQGYVDEDADVMGNFMKLFTGGKEKKKENEK